MRGTRPAVPTGPGITAQEGMPTSWQGTARSPAISAKLSINQSLSKHRIYNT